VKKIPDAVIVAAALECKCERCEECFIGPVRCPKLPEKSAARRILRAYRAEPRPRKGAK
jgi:hypothetical protein